MLWQAAQDAARLRLARLTANAPVVALHLRFPSPPHKQRLRPMNFAPVLLIIRMLSSRSPRPFKRPSIELDRDR